LTHTVQAVTCHMGSHNVNYFHCQPPDRHKRTRPAQIMLNTE